MIFLFKKSLCDYIKLLRFLGANGVLSPFVHLAKVLETSAIYRPFALIFIVCCPRNAKENLIFITFHIFHFKHLFMGSKNYKTESVWLFHRVYGIIYDSINSTYAKLMRERNVFVYLIWK